MRIILKRTIRGLTFGIDYHMTVFRAALSRHKVVFALYFVEVRAFKETSACTRPDGLAWRELFACFDVYFALCNTMVASSSSPLDISRLCRSQNTMTVDTALLNINRLRPFTMDIVSVDIEISAIRDVGRYHVNLPLLYLIVGA